MIEFMAPPGTVAVIWLSETTVKDAGMPPKVTLVVPVKAEPVMVNCVPAGPLAGENPVTFGAGGVALKFVEVLPVPAELVTVMGPVVAVNTVGTVAVSCVSELTEKPAAVPLKATAVVPVKWLPVMVTGVPAVPLVGEKELIVGGAAPFTVKLLLLVAVKPLLVTQSLPLVAPLGTLVDIWLSDSTVKAEGVPWTYWQ